MKIHLLVSVLAATGLLLLFGLMTAQRAMPIGASNQDITVTVTVVNQAPTITTIVPNSGTQGGGTAFQVNGDNFVAGMVHGITIHGTPCTGVVVVNKNTLTAVTGASPGWYGLGDVVITRADGGSVTLVNGYRYLSMFSVTQVTPGVGSVSGGTALAVIGNGFDCSGGGPTVQIGSRSYSGTDIVCDGSTLKLVTQSQPAGTYDVIVVNPDGNSGTLLAGYTYNSLGIVSVDPAQGACGGGTKVYIRGVAFVQGATVWFGSTAAKYAAVTGTGSEIVAYTAAHLEGKVRIRVVNPGGDAGIFDSYTYERPKMAEVRWTKLKEKFATTVKGRWFGVKEESELKLEAVVVSGGLGAGKRVNAVSRVMSPSINSWAEGQLLVDVSPEVVEGDLVLYVLGVEQDRLHVMFTAQGAADLSNVVAYPNPYRKRGDNQAVNGELKFRNLTGTSVVKIYNLRAELVRTLNVSDAKVTTLAGDNAYGLVWDGRNESGEDTASGLYFYLVTDDESHKATGKILILR